MHKIIKEVKSSHLNYIQEELEKLTNFAITKDNKQVVIKESTGTFKDKEQLRIDILTNDINVWNEFFSILIDIDELVKIYRSEGYQYQQSVKYIKGKETRSCVIILHTEKGSLYYGFGYRTSL
nr:MAG TPA: hypothetical protein [Caudoviricetes sp.]